MRGISRGASDAVFYPVRWVGDNIGLTGRDEFIAIELRMGAAQPCIVTLRQALAIFETLDGYGRNRITQALTFNAKNNCLCSEDQAAWQHWCSAHPKLKEPY